MRRTYSNKGSIPHQTKENMRTSLERSASEVDALACHMWVAFLSETSGHSEKFRVTLPSKRSRIHKLRYHDKISNDVSGYSLVCAGVRCAWQPTVGT
jgi:hypothetical protein